MNFTSFPFDSSIVNALDRAGYTEPTPIQSRTIGPILEGRDLLGLAQTGTGKTAAFVLPILQRLIRGQRCTARALVLSPTRELAEQTRRVFETFGKSAGIKAVSIYGGVSQVAQLRSLKRDLPEVIVACPGRLLDLIGQRIISLKSIETLVLDEADQMFDMGFLPSVRKIIATLPEKHQTLMFSATLPEEMEGLAAEFLKRALRVEIDASRPVETISHIVYPVTQADKNAVLSEILKDTATGQALIFVRTKYRAKKLAAHLSDGGLLAASLHGNLSQAQRDKAMQKFRSGNVRIMVATDIVARGIDISGISHVINFDMPDTSEAYTHRIGRTGRMMHRGAALTLATPEDRAMLKTIERLVGGKIERKVVVLPSNTVVAALDEGGEVRRARPAASQRTHDEHSRERPRDQHKTSPQPSGISVAASAVLPARHGTARGHGSSRKAMRHTRAGQSKAYISIP